jgi:hypothetical protein
MAEHVTIKINVDADTASIARVRAELALLCKEVDDCTKTQEKHSKALDKISSRHKALASDMGKTNDELTRLGRGHDNAGKKVSLFQKGLKSVNNALKSVAKLGFKYVAIEAAAAAAVIGFSGIAFKLAGGMAKGYQAALGAVSYALAGVVAIAATFFAAQRQFQSVQFAPKYAEGAANTADKFQAASGAMKMFTDDADLAVLGSKALSSAFKTLSDQAPVTGQTTAVFRSLSDYTSGMGGDLEKGSQAMASFLATFQKKKNIGSVMEEGKKLGPDFTKILNEANKLGIKTYDQFAAAAMKGELGETFGKYAGNLDALNGTLIGSFKKAVAGIKSMFIELGEPMLGPATAALQKVSRAIEILFIRLQGNVSEFGSGQLLEGIVSIIEKMTRVLGDLLNNKMGKTTDAFNSMKRGWEGITGFFEKIQDYLRPLQDAAGVLWETLKPILGAFGGNFDSSIQQLSDSLVNNKEAFVGFGQAIGTFLTAVGGFGTMVKSVIIDLLPTLSDSLNIFSDIISSATPAFKILLSLLKPILKTINLIFKGFLGFVNIIPGLKSLTSAVLLLGAALALSYAKKDGMVRKGIDFVKDGKARNLGDKVTKYGRKGIGAAKTALTPGSAAGGAAIAAAGLYGSYKVADLTSNLFKDDSVKSRTGSALAGAAGGAAVGATAGAALTAWGGPLAIVGAAGGAAIGAVVGGITGYLKAGKERKQTRAAANTIVEGYGSAIEKAVKNGDVKGLQAAQQAAQQKVQEMLSKGGYSASAIKKREADLRKLDKQVVTYSKNAQLFQQYAGADADEMNKILKDLKISGTDSVVNILDVLKSKGQQAWDTIGPMMDDFNAKLLDARLAMFDLPMQTLEAQKALDAAQNKLITGDLSKESLIDFLKKDFVYTLGKVGGDVGMAVQSQKKSLELAYGKGGALETVAAEVKGAYKELNLGDYGTLLDQIIATGKLQYQAILIAASSGGKITEAEALMNLSRNVLTGKGAESDIVFKNLVKGTISQEKATEYFNTGAKGTTEAGKSGLDTAAGKSVFTELERIGKIKQFYIENPNARALPPSLRESGQAPVTSKQPVVAPSSAGKATTLNGGITINITTDVTNAKGTAEKVTAEIQRRLEKLGTR